jgi:peptidoglycan hydrolase-like protein with peptidoglycan-binding domain
MGEAAMKGCNIVAGVAGCVALLMAAILSGSIGSYAAGMVCEVQDVETTPALIREIQFMLLRLGMEPGPIDGIVGPQTTNAVHKFQEHTGLPIANLVNEGKVSMAVLSRLRSEASRVIFGNEKERGTAPGPGAATPAPVALTPAQPVPQPPDRFANCTFDPEDFRIGTTQYTPDKYLQVGFDGSTARAVASLKARLDEARQLAGNIGGSALTEVQRQSRVLNYFNCRLKIEQASENKN